MAQAEGKEMVTLRVAAEAVGVSISALRKWYRNGKVRSKMVEGPNGPQRLVSLDDVRAQASKFQVLEGARTTTAREDSLTHEVMSGRGLLVPRDSWDRMMDQLGNLHQAAQEMAEAKAEAAKQATANEFLRERVRELQDQLEKAKTAHEESLTAGRRSRWRREA